MIPDKEILQNYINDNIPQWKIGEYFGVNQATVSNWFKKYGLKSKIKTGGAHNIKDLTGKRFGKLQVMSYINTDSHGKNYLCKCDCGNEKIFRGSTLTSGKIIGCGCSIGKPNANKKHEEFSKSKIGEKYNKLTIIGYKENEYKGQNGYLMICKCDCGNITYQVYADLKSGKVKSCGCYAKEIASINGSTIGMNNYINDYEWYFIKNNRKVKCRSGYEVIYANWLMKNDIDFEYEPKCFVLDNDKRYTPDFYLSKTDEWVEIKGSFKAGNSHQKDNINIFKINHNHKILFWDDIVCICNLPYKSYSTYFRHADKNHISREDYLAKSLYDE